MMSTAASTEFMALCQAQLRLLAEGLGASISIVYMTEELENGAESKLLPIVVYPETSVARAVTIAQIAPQSVILSPNQPLKQIASSEGRQVATLAPIPERSEDDYQTKRHQILLPLVYDGTILGLLATTREAQPWNQDEQMEIQHVAQTIALAGVLDKRRNWLAIELQHQQALQLQQRDLLHNLLHQLRNPLTAIRTFGKLLIKKLQPGDPNQTFSTSIVRESDRLQELLQHVETAIDITLVSVDPFSPQEILPLLPPSSTPPQNANLLLPDAALRIESCQLADALDPLIISAEAIAQDRNLRFHAHVPQNLPLIQATPAALREVLSNLIDNALKYTPAGGEVDIDVELQHQQPPTLQICIRDTGSGIPPDDLKKLFTRHYRGIQAQGSIQGTGLGLAIAKELITHMNGKIEITSPPPGCDRGTEFTLQLLLSDRPVELAE